MYRERCRDSIENKTHKLFVGADYIVHEFVMADFGSILQTSLLKSDADYLAPDSSEIRLVPTMSGGGLCHCTLPAGKTSKAVKHRTVEEIWFFLEGQGEVWRKLDDHEEIVKVKPGISLTIPVGTHFQFRNTGSEALRFIIVTMLPWPGPEEAKEVKNNW